MRACLSRQGVECVPFLRTHAGTCLRNGFGHGSSAHRFAVGKIDRRECLVAPLTEMLEYRFGTVAEDDLQASSSPSFGAIVEQRDSPGAGSLFTCGET